MATCFVDLLTINAPGGGGGGGTWVKSNSTTWVKLS